MNKNLELQAIIKKELKKINIIINKSIQTQIPLTSNEITRIIEIANRSSLILPIKVLNTLYDNKQNVKFIINYIKPKIVTFFKAKKLLTSEFNDQYFDIKLLNLCIKVKKDTLQFEDNEVLRTELFEDFESLKVACKLYVWNVKLNECAALNLLDDREIQARYAKNTGRLCRIANVPVKYEPTTDPEVAGDGSGESSIIPEDDGTNTRYNEDGSINENNEEDSSSQDGSQSNDQQDGSQSNDQLDNNQSTDQQDENQITDQQDVNQSTDQQDVNQNTTSETFNNIEKFSISFKDEDYQYIITTSIFIFILYLLYVTYK
jgi:hypothetical protein